MRTPGASGRSATAALTCASGEMDTGTYLEPASSMLCQVASFSSTWVSASITPNFAIALTFLYAKSARLRVTILRRPVGRAFCGGWAAKSMRRSMRTATAAKRTKAHV